MVEIIFVEGVEAADVEEEDPRVDLVDGEHVLSFVRFYGLFYVNMYRDGKIMPPHSFELQGPEMDKLIEELQRLRAIDSP